MCIAPPTAYFRSRKELTKAKRIVIKLGTHTVVDSSGKFNYGFAYGLAKQINDLRASALHADGRSRAQGKEFVIVSSGAIGLGNSHLGWKKSGELVLNQCAASVGQNLLMYHYSNCFREYGISIAQLLLTHSDLEDRERARNVKYMTERLIDLGIIPIINENDSVSTEEITFGDNDILSAQVCSLIRADLLILLSNVDGLYRDFEKKELISLVESIGSGIKECVSSKTSDSGKGGMSSKLLAAEQAGAMTVVANCNEENVITRILNGEEIGTLFYLNGGGKR